MNAAITGASRGIGLEFCRLALNNDFQVFAISRQSDATGLRDLEKQYGPRLKILNADITTGEGIGEVSDAIREVGSLDLLINNAGVFCKGESLDDFYTSFHVNSVAPFQLTRTLLPYLRQASAAKVVQITSLMGSVADNGSGGSYAYRASKAALNMLNKCLAVENSWLTAVVLHPGWVKTDMGGAGAPLAVTDSVRAMWKVIASLRGQDSGAFFDYRGQPLPW